MFDSNFLFQIQNFRIMKTKKRFQNSKNRSRNFRNKKKKKKKKRDYATKRQQIFENITRRNFLTFEYVEIEIINFIVENNVKNIQIFVNQFIFFIRIFSVFIRFFIIYFEFSIIQFFSIFYYDFFFSSQMFRSNQMYNQ